MSSPLRQIRALHDEATITVYQAYQPAIGDYAIRHGRFADSYDRGRMTWIKPSFLWMMYRCGWAEKPGQERVLAIRLSHAGFQWALANSALSHYDSRVHADRAAWKDSLGAPVRIQWDPERDLRLKPLAYRAIQIGLSGQAVERYCDEWIQGIDDVTPLAQEVHALVRAGREVEAAALLPVETGYPVAPAVAERVGADDREGWEGTA
jgi:Domain of unknown function (DUF4291)